MNYLGIRKFAPIIRLKGNFDILMSTGVVNCSDINPYLGLPPDVIQGIRPNFLPAYILFIENATTFNRYTREIQDKGWVVYTIGFPSRSWEPVFRELVVQAGSKTPVYHWGDIDIGGYRIMMYMQAILENDLKPLHMPEPDIEVCSSTKSIAIKDLRSVIQRAGSPSIKALDDALKSLQEENDSVSWVEQEQLELKAPL